MYINILWPLVPGPEFSGVWKILYCHSGQQEPILWSAVRSCRAIPGRNPIHKVRVWRWAECYAQAERLDVGNRFKDDARYTDLMQSQCNAPVADTGPNDQYGRCDHLAKTSSLLQCLNLSGWFWRVLADSSL